jgi:hypothetical protein
MVHDEWLHNLCSTCVMWNDWIEEDKVAILKTRKEMKSNPLLRNDLYKFSGLEVHRNTCLCLLAALRERNNISKDIFFP